MESDQSIAEMEASDVTDGIPIALIPRATANSRRVADSKPGSQTTTSLTCTDYASDCIAANCKTWTNEQLTSEYKKKPIIFGDEALIHNHKYQVLLEVVNVIEFYTAISNMEEEEILKVIIGGYPYFFGSWGNVPVVMIQTGEKMGSQHENGSENRTRLALKAMPQIKNVFAVGVCGGVVKKDDDKIVPTVELGQVVISSKIIGYDHQKKKPEQDENRSFNSNSTQNKFYQFLMRPDNREDGTKFGPVFSGSCLVANVDAQQQFLSFDPLGVGIEMEGIGIASACQNADTKVECLVVKSVSDHAGADKNDDWQPVAARNAVKYLSKMLNRKYEEDQQSRAGSNEVSSAVSNGHSAWDPSSPHTVKPVQVTEANGNGSMMDGDAQPMQPVMDSKQSQDRSAQQPITDTKQTQYQTDLVIPKEQSKESAATNSAKPGVFVVYEHDEEFDEYLDHFCEVLRRDGVNCEVDQYHANNDILNWNFWCENQIKKAKYILLVCSPQLHDKLSFQSADDSGRVKMKFGYINSSTLRPLLEEGSSSDHVIPIVSNSYKPQDCILSSLSTRSCYKIPFDQLMDYNSVTEVIDIPDFSGFVYLVARLTGQNLVPKPPVASEPPMLTRKPKH